MVWPDASTEWRNVDEYPDTKIREHAWSVFNRLAKLDEVSAFALGAQKGPFDPLPFLRLDAAAHDDFLGWRQDIERRLRTGTYLRPSRAILRSTENWCRRSH